MTAARTDTRPVIFVDGPWDMTLRRVRKASGPKIAPGVPGAETYALHLMAVAGHVISVGVPVSRSPVAADRHRAMQVIFDYALKGLAADD
jgi:hypothetical protein